MVGAGAGNGDMTSSQAKGTKSTLFLTHPWLTAYSHIKFCSAPSIGCSDMIPMATVFSDQSESVF